MDLTFVALLVVFTVVLMSVCALNGVPQTGDLLKVFTALRRQNPSAAAYSLGYDSQRKLYRNVYARPAGSGDRLEAFVSWEQDPVTVDGNYLSNADHGTVEDLENGFRVSGLNAATAFACPDGYEGASCLPSALCTADEFESAKTKPLTYAQFNALNLYRNTFARKSADLASGQRDAVGTHPRIRIQCLTDGSYELQVCPDHKLIDPATVQCREYDVCQDRVNGFKHDNRIADVDGALRKGEYYMCADNKSERKACRDPDAVFSATDQACVVRSVCFDRGKIQLPGDDDNHYVQCRADTAHTVYCKHGLQKHSYDGTISCITKTCKPYTLRYNDRVLDYVYGQNVCDSRDTPTLTLCDNTPTAKSFDFKWADRFQLNLENWPKTVLDEASRTCVAPTDDIILPTATVDLAWSPAMHEAHKFNIRKRQYECGETMYRWDYVTGSLVPPVKGRAFVDPAAPCQSTAVGRDLTDWVLLAKSSVGVGSVKYHPANTNPPLVIVVHLVYDPPQSHYFWPVYLVAKKKYTFSVCKYDPVEATHTLYKFINNFPPCGFAKVTGVAADETRETIPLALIGYAGFPVDVIKKYTNCMYYVVASGKTEHIRFTRGNVREFKRDWPNE